MPPTNILIAIVFAVLFIAVAIYVIRAFYTFMRRTSIKDVHPGEYTKRSRRRDLEKVE